jgi:hypothetical protein
VIAVVFVGTVVCYGGGNVLVVVVLAVVRWCGW